ncbi:hypothetical protein LMG7974_01742 [Campylobacter majalis]|uniref:Uncharacterized protein n=1 Tax=Campylobacter majalis TaxID=2790656 RepID=A0ABM8Q9X2_9BACT|nr:hypothetical protein [Campylobacter majalis]CAD7289665.1 hypothetical protein LMG7974_01742 [Campylobacter majalis]
MLQKVLGDEKFGLLMKMHVYECMQYLLENEINFSIMTNLSLVSFSPPLPDSVSRNFNLPAIVFMLAGYTFDSAVLSDDEISFEAGFGEQNYASTVTVPLGAVLQIAINDNPILINFANATPPKRKISNLEKSIKIFKSNPNNKL